MKESLEQNKTNPTEKPELSKNESYEKKLELEDDDETAPSESEKNIARETPKKLIESALEDLETDALVLDKENIKDILKGHAESIGLDKSVVEKILQEEGLSEKFEDISKRAKDVLERAKKKLKEIATFGMATLALSCAPETKEININNTSPGQSIEESIHQKPERIEDIVDVAVESVEKEKSYEKTIAEMRRLSIEKRNEKHFVIIETETGYEVLDKTIGNETSVEISVDHLFNKLNDSSAKGEVIFAHTHPAHHAYEESEIDQMKLAIEKGEEFSEDLSHKAIPPSLTDIFSSMDIARKIKERNFSKIIREKVIEPFGVWEYSVDTEKNEFGDILDDINNSFYNALESLPQNRRERRFLRNIFRKNSLPKIYNSSNRTITSALLFRVMEELKENADNGCEIASDFYEKITKELLNERETLREKYPDSFENFRAIISNENIIKGNDFRRPICIIGNLSIYRRNGVDINFRPFDEDKEE